MDTSYRNITIFFEDLLSGLECQYDTKAYIASIFGKFKTKRYYLVKKKPKSPKKKPKRKKWASRTSRISGTGDLMLFTARREPSIWRHLARDWLRRTCTSASSSSTRPLRSRSSSRPRKRPAFASSGCSRPTPTPIMCRVMDASRSSGGSRLRFIRSPKSSSSRRRSRMGRRSRSAPCGSA